MSKRIVSDDGVVTIDGVPSDWKVLRFSHVDVDTSEEAQQRFTKDGVLRATVHFKVKAAHHCHAKACTREVKPELLMCFEHWRMVPKKVQRAVWDNYRPGQCDDKRPSNEWHVAADAAIAYVALREQRLTTAGGMAALEFFGLAPRTGPR